MEKSSTPAGRSVLFRFGEFTFDSASHLLLRNGEKQHLSPKAQQLLRMLILNRSRAVSREEIYDALWPSTFVCETNMASIVSELRHTLGDDARSAQYIRTIHGFGYAFAAEVEGGSSRSLAVAMLLCEGERHLLYDGENTVGRSHDCHVVLTGATASRRHAVIVISGNTISIEDCGSRNGTFVRGKRITQAVVRHQDLILFGTVQASIVQRISSTMPFPLHVPGQRRHSSGSHAPA